MDERTAAPERGRCWGGGARVRAILAAAVIGACAGASGCTVLLGAAAGGAAGYVAGHEAADDD